MLIRGQVKNGVVVLEGGPPLPEGTAVIVSCDVPSPAKELAIGRVKFPLVRSKHPGTVQLTADRVAELLEENEGSS